MSEPPFYASASQRDVRIVTSAMIVLATSQLRLIRSLRNLGVVSEDFLVIESAVEGAMMNLMETDVLKEYPGERTADR